MGIEKGLPRRIHSHLFEVGNIRDGGEGLALVVAVAAEIRNGNNLQNTRAEGGDEREKQRQRGVLNECHKISLQRGDNSNTT